MEITAHRGGPRLYIARQLILLVEGENEVGMHREELGVHEQLLPREEIRLCTAPRKKSNE